MSLQLFQILRIWIPTPSAYALWTFVAHLVTASFTADLYRIRQELELELALSAGRLVSK
jgi:hypothetical protein